MLKAPEVIHAKDNEERTVPCPESNCPRSQCPAGPRAAEEDKCSETSPANSDSLG